ncbi:MAG: (2Fe-2S)-binding protein, partial [Oscillospiraceae bacterium]|nr:(2Fe-2S)-binding protein [Oscillospiraceae bacterium]
MEMVNIKINGMPLSVPAGITILEAARMHGIDIPTLCFLKEINEIGACRICVVEVKGARGPVASCVYPVAEGMEVFTNTP